MRNHMKVFRTIGKRVFRSSRYCVLLLGAVVCSTCAYAVPPDEIDWGWRIKPTFPNEAYGPKTDVNPELTGDNHLFDVWAPDGDGLYPVVIYAHGGGFGSGDKMKAIGSMPKLAEDKIVFVSINYTLKKGPQKAIQDGIDAIDYIIANHQKFKIDPEKIFLSGNSAGGIMMNHIIFDRKTPGVIGAWHSAYYKTQFADLSLENLKEVGVPIAVSMGKLYPEDRGHSPLAAVTLLKKNVAAGSSGMWIGSTDGAVKQVWLDGKWIKNTSEVIDTGESYPSMAEWIHAVAEEQPQTEVAEKWTTIGFQQPNSMGAGEAAIRETGKLRVFILMGQSNMNGSGRAKDLEAPYDRKHERIRIWANGRWEYMVPHNKFGPGVSFAHQLADLWPDDTIGIIKVSCGATGISAFEKNWSFERAERSKDGKKGPMYQDLMNAVAEAKRISEPEFCGFVWKQGAADGKIGLAEEYYDNFKRLISDLRQDLDAPNLPVFVPSYANDKELLKAVLSTLSKADALKARQSAGKGSVKDEESLQAVLAYIDENGLLKTSKPTVKKRRYLATVISAQNRAGRELSNVVTLYPGELPLGDGVHYSSDGYVTLGTMTASAVEEFYRTTASRTNGSSIRRESK